MKIKLTELQEIFEIIQDKDAEIVRYQELVSQLNAQLRALEGENDRLRRINKRQLPDWERELLGDDLTI